MSASSAKLHQGLESDDLGELILQVRDLHQRVHNLEMRVGTAASLPEPAVADGDIAHEAQPQIPAAILDLPPNIVPALGRMLLALAGAYVLRALTEFGTIPAAAGVSLGLFYALVWLCIAARAPANSKFTAVLVSSTSVLILAPLVWEATERLKVMSTWTSAAALTAFALIASWLAARSHHGSIATIAGTSSILLLGGLMLASNDIAPYTAALLVVAAAAEFAAWRDRPAGVRVLAALAADACVLAFSSLMANGRGMPETWVSVSPYALPAAQFALALLYVATAITQTIVRRRTLAGAEIVQTAMALLIGIGGAVWVFRDHRAVMIALGFAALFAGIASYAVSFLLFERDNRRNFRAWGAFGLFLVLAGIYLPFPRSEFWALACACAVATCWTAKAFHLPTLGLHGAIYLLLGSAAASATAQPLKTLFGAGSGAIDWRASLAVLLAACVCWAAIAGAATGASGRWRNQISSLAITAHIVWIAAGVAAYALVTMWRAAAGEGPDIAAPADTLGTVVLVSLSLALAWMGVRWGRRELVWLLCALMALGGYKLAMRDFMQEHNLALVISLLCYGGALIVLPRMVRARSSAGSAGNIEQVAQ